ncbi:hypothetical protein ALO80_200051 [Pseudomonas caricapapayae]|uniref:Uncharacterized protein n=1 Tax=Pseudomonas caricapapayae TaxID=46678 RepID=A0A0P9L278_9PSED|nr:hypothetical protein ALO80_200051 [Pseudomonas caricapapayae]RMM06934.1 hypothetical protein ALQ84_200260 [Pseudomonas caricapapayae]
MQNSIRRRLIKMPMHFQDRDMRTIALLGQNVY